MTNNDTSWADKIQTGRLPAQEACQCLYSTITEKLDYPLTSLTLSKKECGELITIIKMPVYRTLQYEESSHSTYFKAQGTT